MCNTTVTENFSELSFITIKIQGIRTRCLIDTGSCLSLASKLMAQRMLLRIQPLTEETNHNQFSANGTPLKLLGTTDVTLDIS
jgi:hypothetical protein